MPEASGNDWSAHCLCGFEWQENQWLQILEVEFQGTVKVETEVWAIQFLTAGQERGVSFSACWRAEEGRGCCKYFREIICF